jgi:hypothetical protein
VLHRTKNVGKFKVDSAIEYLEGYGGPKLFYLHGTMLD